MDPRFAAGIVVSAALFGVAVWIVYQNRMTPLERERRRRVAVNRTRRTTEAIVTEATAEMIHYQYELRGVRYFASQDVSALGAHLPADMTRLIGAVSAKYDTNNPANSIVVCEHWSGLPERKITGEANDDKFDEAVDCGASPGGSGSGSWSVSEPLREASDDHPRGDVVL